MSNCIVFLIQILLTITINTIIYSISYNSITSSLKDITLKVNKHYETFMDFQEAVMNPMQYEENDVNPYEQKGFLGEEQ